MSKSPLSRVASSAELGVSRDTSTLTFLRCSESRASVSSSTEEQRGRPAGGRGVSSGGRERGGGAGARWRTLAHACVRHIPSSRNISVDLIIGRAVSGSVCDVGGTLEKSARGRTLICTVAITWRASRAGALVS